MIEKPPSHRLRERGIARQKLPIHKERIRAFFNGLIALNRERSRVLRQANASDEGRKKKIRKFAEWKKKHLFAMQKSGCSREQINQARDYLDRSFTTKESRILEKLTEGLLARAKWRNARFEKMPREATAQEKAALEKTGKRFVEIDRILNEKNSEASTFNTIDEEYEKNLRRAIRLGIGNHPLVAEYVQVRRNVGDWQFLRRAKIGLERHVKKPKTIDSKLKEAIIACHKKAKTASRKKPTREQIKRMLIAQRTLPTSFSRNGFHKMVTRFGLQKLFS